MTKIVLNKEELAVLIDYGTRNNRTGGFQGLVKALYAATDRVTGVMELEDDLLGKAVRYAISYGPGGFQDTFLRPMLRRSLRL